jgi:hypothetical protein
MGAVCTEPFVGETSAPAPGRFPDPASLDSGQFKADGGFARLNKVFDGKLEAVLGELAEEVWKDAG